jgi:hypothetical protein
MDALRHAKGDVQQAFRAELARMPLNCTLLLSLVQEYVLFRGLEADLKDSVEAGLSNGNGEGPKEGMMIDWCGREGSASVHEECTSGGRKNWLEVEEWIKNRGGAEHVIGEDNSVHYSGSLGTSRREDASPSSISSLDESGVRPCAYCLRPCSH